MGKILLHPTHRKFIRMLREQVGQGKLIIVTKSDIDTFRALMQRTKIALERHKGIYKLLLRAMQRTEAHKKGDIILNSSHIDYIESVFFKAEWGNIFITIRNIILQPILCKAIKFLDKHSKNTDKYITRIKLYIGSSGSIYGVVLRYNGILQAQEKVATDNNHF